MAFIVFIQHPITHSHILGRIGPGVAFIAFRFPSFCHRVKAITRESRTLPSFVITQVFASGPSLQQKFWYNCLEKEKTVPESLRYGRDFVTADVVIIEV